jgi:NAD(P)H dehydrogenase (quinone)
MIVVTGANGRLGRLVAAELERKAKPSGVALGSRDPSKLADFSAKGFKTLRADFEDAASLETAFAGAKTVLIISGDAPVEVRIRQHRAAVDAAKKVGVGRVVYTSFTNPSEKSLFPFGAIHGDTEAYLKASGIPYTILRNNQYAENLTNGLARARETGVLAQPGATGKVAYIGRADVAAAIAGALTQDGHAGKTYEITGPEAADLFQIAAALSQGLGKPVRAVDADPKEFEKVFTSMGMPPFMIAALLGIFAAAAAGEMANVSQDAARLAGRPIEKVTDYVRRTAQVSQAA